MPISNTRRIVSGLLLSFGIFFAVSALAIFAMPFIAAATGNYEGGEQAIGAFFFYLLLALPSFLFTASAIFVRGWREARAGYITLACLLGIPVHVFIAALVQAI